MESIGLGDIVKLTRLHQEVSDLVVEQNRLSKEFTINYRKLEGLERMLRRLLENERTS